MSIEVNESASWDPTWETVFATRQWGKYPPEELIRFVARRFSQVADRSQVSILELGCGGGACVWYMAREGFNVTGIDGAPSALSQAEHLLRKENLKAQLLLGDVTQLSSLTRNAKFDAIVDVACLQHNKLADVSKALEEAYNSLLPGGHFFSSMVSTGTIGEGDGTAIDTGTWTNIRSGPLAERGLTHFFTLDELEALFSKFENVEIEQVSRTLNNLRDNYKQWIVTGSKSIDK